MAKSRVKIAQEEFLWDLTSGKMTVPWSTLISMPSGHRFGCRSHIWPTLDWHYQHHGHFGLIRCSKSMIIGAVVGILVTMIHIVSLIIHHHHHHHREWISVWSIAVSACSAVLHTSSDRMESAIKRLYVILDCAEWNCLGLPLRHFQSFDRASTIVL